MASHYILTQQAWPYEQARC